MPDDQAGDDVPFEDAAGAILGQSGPAGDLLGREPGDVRVAGQGDEDRALGHVLLGMHADHIPPPRRRGRRLIRACD
jgi:hypothetical protein